MAACHAPRATPTSASYGAAVVEGPSCVSPALLIADGGRFDGSVGTTCPKGTAALASRAPMRVVLGLAYFGLRFAAESRKSPTRLSSVPRRLAPATAVAI